MQDQHVKILDSKNLVGFTLLFLESDERTHHFGGCQNDMFLIWFKLKVLSVTIAIAHLLGKYSECLLL